MKLQYFTQCFIRVHLVWNLNKNTNAIHCTKIEVSIKDFFNKCDQILSFLRIWSHLLKKSLMENFIFCAVISALLNFSNLKVKLKTTKKYLQKVKILKPRAKIPCWLF